MSISKKLRRLPFVLAGLAMGLGVFINVNSSKSVQSVDAIGNYSTNASTYYSGITATSGKQLAAQLHDLITSTHRYYTSYADNGGNKYQQQTDKYYENGSAVSGYIYEFYSGVKWPNAWDPNSGSTTGGYNREHCWCQSNSVNNNGTQMWGESGGGADMHHLRPVEVRLNSTRSNNEYGELSNRDSYKVYAKLGSNSTYALGGYNNGGTFEPLDSKKGDVARIILYTYLHYNSYTISDLFGSYGTTNGNGSSSYFSTSLLSLTKTTNKTSESAALTMLLQWNSADPVDQIEQRRNEQVAIYQGNRNPFIDNSSYADMIWNSGGSSTPTVNSVSVSPSTLNLDLNGTKTGNLTATVNVSNGAAQTVTWTSSNTNVATVSSSGVVTAVAKGTCTVTATSTVNSNKSASCTVKVTDSGSGGGGGSSSNDYELYSGAISSGKYVIYYSGKAMNTTVSSNRLGYTEVTVTNDVISNPASSIIWDIQASGDYWTLYNESANAYAASTGTKNQAQMLGSGTDNKSLWTVSGTSTYEFVNKNNAANSVNANLRNNGTYGFACYSTSTGGALSLYKQATSSSSGAVLSSISLNTSNVQKDFYTGETFDYSGLIVTANYEDGTEDIVNPTNVSSPNMSTAGTKTVTVTYTENNVSKSATYTISVTTPVVSAIYASVDKTYHPGETISSSDITVEDNLGNEITSFTFANNGYQFTYNDAESGGALTNKTFENAVSYSTFTCSLTVQVQRKNRANSISLSDVLNQDFTGISGTTYTAFSLDAPSSGGHYVGNCAGDKSSIQLRSSADKNGNYAGIVTTVSCGIANQVSVVWQSDTSSGRTLNIYGKNSAYSSANDLYNDSNKGTLLGTIVKGTSDTLTINGSYAYIGLCSNSGAMYLTSITISYPGSDTAENLSNYIMYEDTNGQCVSKLNTAIGYLSGLNSTERTNFQTSNDYVISTARTRLEAWARSQGKTINYTNGTLSAENRLVSFTNKESNNAITMLIILSMISVSSIGASLYIRKKRSK